jgi:hypothetical protein
MGTKRNAFCVYLFLAAGLAAGLVACGGGGGGGGEAGDTNNGWITIDAPALGPDNIEYCNYADIGGEAFISPTWYRCCSDSAEDTGVTVTWENKTTGESGYASQYAEYCYLPFTPSAYICGHTWNVSAPLAIGNNLIVVTATDPSGNTGTDSITVAHPEESYAVSGKVVNQNGTGIGFGTAPFTVQLTGVDIDEQQRVSESPDAGSFGFACLPNGSYTLTAQSGYLYDFQPESYTVTVNNADVSGVDFVTEAYFISGYVKWPSGSAYQDGWISLSVVDPLIPVDDPLITTFTDEQGFYDLAVPNGTYTIVPASIWGESFIPMSMTVPVNNADAGNVNFTVD